MDFLVQTILPYVLLYKYWALFVITFLSSLIPIPVGSLLMASAAFASQGYLNFMIVLLVVTIASIIGDTVCYWLARWYGKKFFNRFAFTRKILDSKNFQLIEKGMQQRPGFIIFISRFEALATLSVNIVCGLSNVSYKRFMLFEVLGAIAYTVFYGLIGYIFGDSWQAVNKLMGNFSIIVFIILIGCTIIFWKKIMANLSAKHLIEQ
jgi:membrane-associated protein